MKKENQVFLRGTGVVYGSAHVNIEVPSEDIATLKVEGATVILQQVGYDSGNKPLTVSEMRNDGFTVYNTNECGVAFNWLVVADSYTGE